MQNSTKANHESKLESAKNAFRQLKGHSPVTDNDYALVEKLSKEMYKPYLAVAKNIDDLYNKLKGNVFWGQCADVARAFLDLDKTGKIMLCISSRWSNTRQGNHLVFVKNGIVYDPIQSFKKPYDEWCQENNVSKQSDVTVTVAKQSVKESVEQLLEGANDADIRDSVDKMYAGMKSFSNWTVRHSITEKPIREAGWKLLALYSYRNDKYDFSAELWAVSSGGDDERMAGYKQPQNAASYVKQDKLIRAQHDLFNRRMADSAGKTDREVFSNLLKIKESSIKHELVHHYDNVRAPEAKKTYDKNDTKKDIDTYFNDPLEFNAFFIQLTNAFIDDFKKNGPINGHKNDKIGVFVDFDHFYNYFMEWIDNRRGYDRLYDMPNHLKGDRKQSWYKRVMQFFTDIKNNKTKINNWRAWTGRQVEMSEAAPNKFQRIQMAIQNKWTMEIMYRGTDAKGSRIIEPYVIGTLKGTANQAIRCYQVNGDTSSEQGWKILLLDDIYYSMSNKYSTFTVRAEYKPYDSDFVKIEERVRR